MIRFLADENFNGKIVRGIRREQPEADIVRVQDTAIYQASDPEVLEWAAIQNRILLSHDRETMIHYGKQRIEAGLPMPGIIIVRNTLPIGQVIEELLMILGASEPEEWNNLIAFLPL
jgi:predicted nuclease of predicted toxin-antitoxin system